MEQNKDVFTIEMFGVEKEVKLEYASYNINGSLALQLFCKPDEDELEYYARESGGIIQDPYCSPYGVVTVNLPESGMLDEREQFVDENNLPGIGRWLQSNGIAEPTGLLAPSGYCCYPAYRFNAPREAMERLTYSHQ